MMMVDLPELGAAAKIAATYFWLRAMSNIALAASG